MKSKMLARSITNPAVPKRPIARAPAGAGVDDDTGQREHVGVDPERDRDTE